MGTVYSLGLATVNAVFILGFAEAFCSMVGWDPQNVGTLRTIGIVAELVCRRSPRALAETILRMPLPICVPWYDSPPPFFLFLSFPSLFLLYHVNEFGVA